MFKGKFISNLTFVKVLPQIRFTPMFKNFSASIRKN